MTTERPNHSQWRTLRSAWLCAVSPVSECAAAHTSAHFSVHVVRFRATAPNYFLLLRLHFSFCLFFVSGIMPKETRFTCILVLMTWRLVTHRIASPVHGCALHTCLPVLCTPPFIIVFFPTWADASIQIQPEQMSFQSAAGSCSVYAALVSVGSMFRCCRVRTANMRRFGSSLSQFWYHVNAHEGPGVTFAPAVVMRHDARPMRAHQMMPLHCLAQLAEHGINHLPEAMVWFPPHGAPPMLRMSVFPALWKRKCPDTFHLSSIIARWENGGAIM